MYQVGLTDDTYELSGAIDHWDGADMLRDQDVRDITNGATLADGNNGRDHDVACLHTSLLGIDDKSRVMSIRRSRKASHAAAPNSAAAPIHIPRLEKRDCSLVLLARECALERRRSASRSRPAAGPSCSRSCAIAIGKLLSIVSLVPRRGFAIDLRQFARRQHLSVVLTSVFERPRLI